MMVDLRRLSADTCDHHRWPGPPRQPLSRANMGGQGRIKTSDLPHVSWRRSRHQPVHAGQSGWDGPGSGRRACFWSRRRITGGTIRRQLARYWDAQLEGGPERKHAKLI